jgi:hypothetical protein
MTARAQDDNAEGEMMHFLQFVRDVVPLVALGAMLSLLVPREQATAQAGTGTVSGVVTVVATGRTLADVGVTLDDAAHTTLTDSTGRFRFAGVSAGEHSITARRIGYGAVSAKITVNAGAEVAVDVEFTSVATQQLDPVNVTADSQRFIGKLAGMEHRRSINAGGTYITSVALDSAAGRSLAWVLARKLSGGAHLVMNNRTGAMLLSSGRGRTSGRTMPPADPSDPRSPRACWAQVYLDGLPIYSIKQGGMPVPDLRDFGVESLSAIEYYAGDAQTPSEFAGEGASCGTLVIWTK